MRKSFLLLAFFGSTSLFAQHCAEPTSSCLPEPLYKIGFSNPEELPCLQRNTPYNQTLRFKFYAKGDLPGGVGTELDSVTIDSLKINSIDLPDGLCWKGNKELFLNNETICIEISGISTSLAGQYKMSMTFTYYIYLNSCVYGFTGASDESYGFYHWLRIIESDSACTELDTVKGKTQDFISYTNDTTQTASIITNTKDNNSISIYPNPSTGNFTLTSDISQGGVVDVYSITGTKIETRNYASLQRVDIDISQQAKGIYLMKVSNAENVWTQRVIVE